MYVPETDDLRLRVLRYKHDHPLLGHFGQNHTLELIRHEYTWPGIRTYVKDYVKSCTACARAKTPCHRPYGMLKQLPVPDRPWNSISMDFIEQLPSSSGFTAILVVIDRLSKQAIFIPTHDTITSTTSYRSRRRTRVRDHRDPQLKVRPTSTSMPTPLPS